MNDVFSTLLTLIPLAIFIAVRMVAEKKKKADAEDRKKMSEAIAQAVETPFKPAAVNNSGGEFSAHALKPDEDELKLKPALEKRNQRPRMLAADSPPSAASEPSISDAFLPEAIKAAPVAAPPASSGGFVSRLEKLPPLKRAIVYAELFGTAKGV